MDIHHELIDRILRTEDIEGFVESGAPQDEYASEAEALRQMFLSLPADRFNTENITAGLVAVWQNSFNLSDEDIALRLPAMQRVAAELLRNIG